jgi:AraC-like DNA-binding protein
MKTALRAVMGCDDMNASQKQAGPRAASMGQRFRVRDFVSRDGVTLDSPDDRLTMEDTLMEGDFFHQELRPGLFLHVSDAIEARPFTASSYVQEGLSCVFFLDGEVGLKIGDRQFSFDGRRNGTAEGTAIMSARADTFERQSHGSQRLRHLVVSASPAWLDLEGLQAHVGGSAAGQLFKQHLASQRWRLTPRAMELVDQITNAPALAPALRNLYLEARTIELVGETLSALLRTDMDHGAGDTLTHQDLVRLKRAREFIETNLTAPLSVDMIGREAGINPSGLQRLFRLAEDTSVFGHVRKLRLERAFEALRSGEMTISEASLFAGYTSPANFSTAFRHRFGMSPKAATRGR